MTDTNTTLYNLDRSAYPGQYYGQIDTTNSVLQIPALDVWNCVYINGQPISNILELPAAADMVALTSEQVSLLQEAPMSGHLIVPVDVTSKTLRYPARYYCDGGAPAAFYDMWGYSSTDHLPDISELHPVTSAQWAERQNSAATGLKQSFWNTASGSLEPYTPPAVVVPLSTKAQSEMSGWVNQQAVLATAMGETFTDEMKAYVKAIQAIATGADTSSTELPQRPAEGKVAAS